MALVTRLVSLLIFKITIARLTSVLFMTNTFFLDNPALLSFLNTRG